MKISKILTKDVVTITPETNIKEIAKLMIKHDLVGIPVVEDGKIAGIVTEGDLIMKKAHLHLPNYIQLLDSFLYLDNTQEIEKDLKKILAVKAKDIMTKDFVTVKLDSTVEDLASVMHEEHVNPIPVMDNDKMVGIASRADLIALIAEN
ncbi:CBS domain-containing protein [Patescibacteria group bacterium]